MTFLEIKTLFPYNTHNVSLLEIDSINGTRGNYISISERIGYNEKFGRAEYGQPVKWFIADIKGNYTETVNPYNK
jgi:hypothetical protein